MSDVIKVVWEEWEQTFFHPMCPLGVYQKRSKEFTSEEAAKGFVQGIRYNQRVRNAKIADKNWLKK